MNGVVEIDDGQDREHIGLQERDQDFEGVDRDRQRQRRDAADPADGAERDPEQRNEAGKDLERDVAGQHVGEQADAVRDRPQEEREDLDEDDQRQDEDRDAGGHEDREEFQAVLVEAVDQHREEHQERQRRGDDDVARYREGVGNDAHEIRDADEHEDREDQRKELH